MTNLEFEGGEVAEEAVGEAKGRVEEGIVPTGEVLLKVSVDGGEEGGKEVLAVVGGGVGAEG